ncbi:MAG: capsular biosynthesis protein [Pseudomonadota bacterium]
MAPADFEAQRSFLFLQGPHGPFFDQLARQLRKSGARCLRVGFNTGDSVFWRDRGSYVPYRGDLADWPRALNRIMDRNGITDLVLYGDVRPIHATAVVQARLRGLRIHIFEEGYLRPYWITYERNGSNGNSILMDLSLAQIGSLQRKLDVEPPMPPCHWGDMRQHMFFGALYHWFVLVWNWQYPRFQPHRQLNVAQEFRLYLRRLILMPFLALDRIAASYRIRNGSFPYHVALLQLEHDSSFQEHGAFDCQEDFLAHVIKAFAKGAPRHHHLVFKAHPLEDGRSPLRRDIKRHAKTHGIKRRVHFVRGGKLAGLLNAARSAVTVNSTSGHQVLWRGLPLKVFGKAIYAKPELVSDQPLAAFFAKPRPPDGAAYRQFRDFLLATSQLPGSFYARKGRVQVIRRITDMMLATQDPYSETMQKSAAHRQQFRVVR